MATRMFHCFGHASHNAIISLTVNNNAPILRSIDQTIKNPFNCNEVLIYQFQTDVQAHGSTKIELKLLEGNIHFGRAIVRYPAVVRQPCPLNGWCWVYQPISDPKFLVKINSVEFVRPEIDQHLTGEWHHSLVKNDVFEYAHLHYNGPNYWEVFANVDLNQFCNVGILAEKIGDVANCIFEYEPQVNNIDLLHKSANLVMARENYQQE